MSDRQNVGKGKVPLHGFLDERNIGIFHFIRTNPIARTLTAIQGQLDYLALFQAALAA